MRLYALIVSAEKDFWTILKFGQFPALERNVPRYLKKFLGEQDEAFLKAALTCRNHSYCIAAVAYLRRVIEDKIDGLLDLISTEGKIEHPDHPFLGDVKKAQHGISFQGKLEIATELLPKRLQREGNPIEHLYSLTSEGLHRKSEEECEHIFDKCWFAITYVVAALNEDQLHQQEFKAKMKEVLAKNKSG